MSDTTHTRDEDLFLSVLKREDKEAFTALYNKYSEPLYYNLLKMVKDPILAEEMVQDIFTRIWQKRGSIQIASSFSGYLFRVARNCVIDFFRNAQRDKKLYHKILDKATENYTHVEEHVSFRQWDQQIQQVVNSLPEQQRKVYQLCVLEGRTYKDTSVILNITPNTVNEYLVKARRKVKTLLQEQYGESSIVLLPILVASLNGL